MIQVNDFQIQLSERPGHLFREIHRQRIRTVEEVKGMIMASAFELVGCYRDFTDEPGTDSCERVHFVLKKCE